MSDQLARDKEAVLNVVLELAEYFGAKLSSAVQRMYVAALADLGPDAIRAAAQQALRICKFMPKVAELREFAEGSPDDHTELAWQQLRDAMRIVGYARSVVFADTRLADAVERVFGGWQQACAADWSDEMWAAKRKEFGRVYRALRLQGRSDHSGHLAGFCETRNRTKMLGADRLLRDGVSQLRTDIGVVPAVGEPRLVTVVMDVTTGALYLDAPEVRVALEGRQAVPPKHRLAAPRRQAVDDEAPASAEEARAAFVRMREALGRSRRDLLADLGTVDGTTARRAVEG